MVTCADCGEVNAARARFCSSCGRELPAAPQRPTTARKTVTIVFCDVTGSTALGERLDPEPLRSTLARYYEEMRSVLERHGGTVEKFIGDAVMAAFGVPLRHEDDALRALRAALEMHDALASLNDELRRDRGVQLAMRVGVNTGLVAAGDPSGRSSFVAGDAVNLAKRLEETAQPGEILIGEETHALVRDAVIVEPRGRVAVKGKQATVAAFRLVDILPDAPLRVARFRSPLVGRDEQRVVVEKAFEDAVSDRACHHVTIFGLPGVGKSRLAQEFAQDASAGATILRGRCLPYGDGITYWPIAEAVKQAAGVDDSDAPEQVHRKLRSLIDADEDAGVIAERIAQTIGMTESSGGTEEISWAVRRLFEALARRRPLVVVIDDVHWAESTFLDLVEHVVDRSRDAPILLVCLARPELLDARPNWVGGKRNTASVFLEPLSDADCDQLVANLLDSSRLAEAAHTRIKETAEGNPLFVEETLAMMIDDGLLVRGAEGWEVASDLSSVRIPPTIDALLGARLDRLNEGERAVIEAAAVEGSTFHGGAVAELVPAFQPDAVRHLMALVRKQLIQADRASLAREDAFRFRHILIRDAAYEATPKHLRSDLHERYASWLVEKVGERIGEYDEIVAYHLEQAHRYRSELGPRDEATSALAARAAERLVGAGRRAFSRGDMSAAAGLFSRALELLPPGDPLRLALLPDLGSALRETGHFEQAEAVLAEALEAAAETGDSWLEAHASISRLRVRMLSNPEGWRAEAQRTGEQLVTTFESLGDEQGLARTWFLIAETYWMQCRFAAAAKTASLAVEHARRAGDARLEAEAMVWVHGAGVIGPMPVAEAIRASEQALAGARGRHPIEASCLLQLAVLAAMRMQFGAARRLLAEARARLEDIGSMAWIVDAAGIAAWIEILAGDAAAAEREGRLGYELLADSGEKGWRATHAANLARYVYEQGRYEAAEDLAQVSERDAASDDVAAQIGWRQIRAKVLARRSEFEQAEALGIEATRLAAQTDALEMHGNALLDLAEVLRLADRPAEATGAVRASLDLYRRKGNVAAAGKALALLGEPEASPSPVR